MLQACEYSFNEYARNTCWGIDEKNNFVAILRAFLFSYELWDVEKLL